MVLFMLSVSCQSRVDCDSFIQTETYSNLFSISDTNLVFDNITIKELIDSVYQRCDEHEYTGDYFLKFPLNKKSDSKFYVRIKGFVCPHSLKDEFFNPLNLYFLNDSIFIESNLNTIDPAINSVEFGDYIGIDSISPYNLTYVERDSLKQIIRKHLDDAAEAYTYPPLIQIIANDSINVNEFASIFKLAINEYYNLYTELSKRVFNKNLQELNNQEIQKIQEVIVEYGLKCKLRINSIQRIQENVLSIPLGCEDYIIDCNSKDSVSN